MYCAVWCNEIGSLISPDAYACNSDAHSDVREPISLHQTVHAHAALCGVTGFASSSVITLNVLVPCRGKVCGKKTKKVPSF